MKTFTPKDRSEVDLRISQEIKNHQDWMYETGQSIRTLKEGLAALAIIQERNIAKLESDYKFLQIDFENLQNEVKEKLHDFSQRIGDLESKCMLMQLDYGDKLFDFSQNFTTKEEQVKSSAFLWGKFKELDEKLKDKSDYTETEFTRVRSQVQEQVASVRKEIPSVEEFKPLKKEIDDKNQAFKVDLMGIIRELALIKKDVAYDQKKFENVYTLIERLKEDKK